MRERLLDFCSISGSSVKTFEGERTYIATADIIENKLLDGTKVTFDNKPSRANQEVEINDVVFAKMMNTKKVIQIDESNVDNIYSTGFYIIKPSDKITSRYLYWFFNSNNFNKQKDMLSTGATMKGINNAGLSKITINALPEINEQNSRVEKLEKLSDLLNKKIEDYAECDVLIDSIYYDSIKDGYTDKKLGDIGSSLIGLTYSPKDISDSGTIVLRSGNIQNGELDFKDTVRVSMSVPEKKMVALNDILICSRNGSKELVGKSALITSLKEPMSFGAFMAIYRSRYNYFLISFFHSKDFRKQLGGASTATINQITSNMLNNIVVKLPSDEIIKKSEKKIMLIEKQKELIMKDIKDIKSIIEYYLHIYFD